MPDIGTVFRVGEFLKKSMQANAIFRQSSQEDVDRIVRAVYKKVLDSRIKLSQMAIDETGLGNFKDKVLKTVVATQFVYEYLKDRITVGVSSHDVDKGITEVLHPIGTVLAIASETDPVASAIFKILISLKTRNSIIIAPHPKAIKVTKALVEMCYEAAVKENAPDDCIQFFFDTHTDEFNTIISDNRISLIIGAGDDSLNDKNVGLSAPVIGAGSGNVPVYVSDSVDPLFAAAQIIASKKFDNGIMNSSEQAVVVDQSITEEFKKAMVKKGAYFVNEQEKELLKKRIFDDDGKVNSDIVGNSCINIAKYAGFDIPESTKIIVVELNGVGKDFPISGRILAPIIAYYTAQDFDAAVNLCIDLNYYGGIGHTVGIYSNDNDKINHFAHQMTAGRVLVNTPCSMGAIGGIYNFLPPSFTQACGSGGRSTTMDNVSIKHLLNVQRICKRRINQRLRDFNKDYWLDENNDTEKLEELYNKNY